MSLFNKNNNNNILIIMQALLLFISEIISGRAWSRAGSPGAGLGWAGPGPPGGV
jgi:hypothetical protein